ncbi:SCA7, zinc-binding domain-containing protein [Sporodiniella umbellata]|nr:SCA7, zinc-binding domain-containing protein [Sporodiniella umbellata]
MAPNGNFKKVALSGGLLTDEQQSILKAKEKKIENIETDIMTLSKPLFNSEEIWGKHVTPNALALFQDEQNWCKVNIKLKNKEFKTIGGSSWSSVKDNLDLDSEEENGCSEADSPETTRFDAKDMEILGSMPMEEETVVVKCISCYRPLLPSRFKAHADMCLRSRLNSANNSENHTSLEKSNRKKLARSQDEDLIREKKLKKQKKGVKEKAPLDLDRQCGVVQPPTNTPCKRSITCKSHSIGAKRAVKGRSETYDSLLVTYLKIIGERSPNQELSLKNKVSSKTSIRTAKPAMLNQEKPLKHLKKLQNQPRFPELVTGENTTVRNKLQNQDSSQPIEEEFFDSDEEIDSIMQAIQTIKPSPLAQKPCFFIRRKRQYFRIRSTLLDAITPKPNVTNERLSLRHTYTTQL